MSLLSAVYLLPAIAQPLLTRAFLVGAKRLSFVECCSLFAGTVVEDAFVALLGAGAIGLRLCVPSERLSVLLYLAEVLLLTLTVYAVGA
jgi:hypothetical protein